MINAAFKATKNSHFCSALLPQPTKGSLHPIPIMPFLMPPMLPFLLFPCTRDALCNGVAHLCKTALQLLTLFILVELLLPNTFPSESLASYRSIRQLCCFVLTCISGQERGFLKPICNSQRDLWLQNHCWCWSPCSYLQVGKLSPKP